MTMDRQPVSSSNISSVGYDPGSLVLEIEFHGGRLYQYSRVPEIIHSGLMSAISKGTFFHEHIRDTYPTKRVN